MTSFRTPLAATGAGEVVAVAGRTSKRYTAIEVVESQSAPIVAALGLPASARVTTAPSAAALKADLAKHADRLGFLALPDVDASVRALAWEGKTLFGFDRVKAVSSWPLVASVTLAGGAADRAYDPATAWTLFSGGDILLDRGIAYTVKQLGKGVDFPWDGGTATITSRYCCSSFGWRLPRLERTGNAGAFREHVEAADLAIANFENPAPDRFRWHEHGTVFSADPALLAGVKNAGVDWVSLANNHIGDAGRAGILQTIANLDDRGIAHGGAGKDYAAAHTATLMRAGGITVGILGYDMIAPSYWASATRAGSAQLTAATVKADIAAARKAGANVVIVFPHWGIEYKAKPSAVQRSMAHAAIDAGADLVIGNHPHWAEAVEVYKGKPIWYALGNLVFDQTWSEPTMEGITLELTFEGTRLVQAWTHPHVILDRSQPNFLDPAGSGKVVMDQVWGASTGILAW